MSLSDVDMRTVMTELSLSMSSNQLCTGILQSTAIWPILLFIISLRVLCEQRDVSAARVSVQYAIAHVLSTHTWRISMCIALVRLLLCIGGRPTVSIDFRCINIGAFCVCHNVQFGQFLSSSRVSRQERKTSRGTNNNHIDKIHISHCNLSEGGRTANPIHSCTFYRWISLLSLDTRYIVVELYVCVNASNNDVILHDIVMWFVVRTL